MSDVAGMLVVVYVVISALWHRRRYDHILLSDRPTFYWRLGDI